MSGGSTQQAAEHHEALYSLPPGGKWKRKRTGNKIELGSWDKSYLLREGKEK